MKTYTRTTHNYSTLAVHGGRRANPYHAIAEPIVQTATYRFENTADLCDYKNAYMLGMTDGRLEYGRYGNPTVAATEARLAALEGADDAILYASGMAAITSVLLSMLSAGSHIILMGECYRRTREFCLHFLKRLGVACDQVATNDFESLQQAIRPETRLLLAEIPTNPYLRVLDVEQFAAIARRHKIKTLLDATFATPINLRPLEWGIDLVVHSASKYLGGHNDLLAGVVAGEAGLMASLRGPLGVLGGVPDPQNAALLLRGVKTLALRVERQNQNGLHVARFLNAHPKIEQVWYPGLETHPDHDIAARLMSGFGGVVSFTVRGSLEETSRFIDSLEIIQLATSLGGTESLIIQPALMSYYELDSEERLALGIPDNLVRLSLGIEDSDDLIGDLAQALTNV